MKNLIIILTLFMLSPFYSIGQRMNDTLVMHIDEKVEMKIVLADYKTMKIDSNQKKVRAKLSAFQEVVKEIKDDLDSDNAEYILFADNDELTVKPGDPTKYYIVNDGVKSSGIRDKAVLMVGDMQVIITSTQMELIVDINLLGCYDQMLLKIPHNSRYAKTHYFECKGEQVELIGDKEEVHSQGDILEFSGGGGVNLYKGQWIGELGLRLDLEFFKKNVLQHNPYFTWSFLYDFSEFDKMHINQMFSVGYSWDRNRGEGDENHFGVELGFLVSRSGDLFEKNTTRFGINWSPAKGIVVSPQMYIIGGFEQVQPGFRIGLGF